MGELLIQAKNIIKKHQSPSPSTNKPIKDYTPSLQAYRAFIEKQTSNIDNYKAANQDKLYELFFAIGKKQATWPVAWRKGLCQKNNEAQLPLIFNNEIHEFIVWTDELYRLGNLVTVLKGDRPAYQTTNPESEDAKRFPPLDYDALYLFFIKRTTSDFEDLIIRLENLLLKSTEDLKLIGLVI